MPGDREILFQDFSAKQKQAFLQLGTAERYAPQAEILKAGEVGSEMLMVEDGIISVWVRDVKVNEVGAESILGVSALIEPHERTASLIAETEVNVLLFRRPKVLKHLETVSAKLFHSFFVNAFHINMNLIRVCEERIVQLSQELDAI